MEYFANFPAGTAVDPVNWAAQKETEGWHGICASDHLWVGPTRYPHVFVAATQMACATSRIAITTSFCNNLFRSPVEFAQAALSLQAAAKGRFEAGLGAGWSKGEIEAMGLTYPDGAGRVSRYIEALTIVRELLRTGQCTFAGKHYQVDFSGAQQLALVSDSPPPLIAAAGGPVALKQVIPLVDRVEIKASSRSTRVGHLDFPPYGVGYRRRGACADSSGAGHRTRQTLGNFHSDQRRQEPCSSRFEVDARQWLSRPFPWGARRRS